MPNHEQKQCSRCQWLFECKSGSILLCQCQTVMLNAQQLDYIAGRYDDCLCSRCLLELRSESNQMQYEACIIRYAIASPERPLLFARHSRAGGNPAFFIYWMPDQARHDVLLEPSC
jgi:hypothetical protein